MNSPNRLTSTFHQSARAFCSHGGSTTIRETKVKPQAILGALAITAALVSLAAQAQTAHDEVGRHHGDSAISRSKCCPSRPDTISGGDALIRVTVKKNVPALRRAHQAERR